MNLNDTLNLKMCNNKQILIDNRPITNTLFTNDNTGRWNDILNTDMSFKTNQDLKWLTVMDYNQLISSIPGNWKKMMNDKKGNNISFKQIDDLQTKIGTKYKEIIYIKCKECCWYQIEETYETRVYQPLLLEGKNVIIM